MEGDYTQPGDLADRAVYQHRVFPTCSSSSSSDRRARGGGTEDAEIKSGAGQKIALHAAPAVLTGILLTYLVSDLPIPPES